MSAGNKASEGSRNLPIYFLHAFFTTLSYLRGILRHPAMKLLFIEDERTLRQHGALSRQGGISLRAGVHVE